MKERWLLVEQIASHLGGCPDNLTKWVECKKMPAGKAGRLWKFLTSKLDQWVNMAAYGWYQLGDAGTAIAIRHDFYEVDYLPENDRVRYTIHPDARKEILKRLLQLNHKLYAKEEAKGLHKKKAGKKTKRNDSQQTFL